MLGERIDFGVLARAVVCLFSNNEDSNLRTLPTPTCATIKGHRALFLEPANRQAAETQPREHASYRPGWLSWYAWGSPGYSKSMGHLNLQILRRFDLRNLQAIQS